MISGAHVMIFTKDEVADRAFLRDVLEIPCIDGGGGWLIFKLPPTEMGACVACGEPSKRLSRRMPCQCTVVGRSVSFVTLIVTSAPCGTFSVGPGTEPL